MTAEIKRGAKWAGKLWEAGTAWFFDKVWHFIMFGVFSIAVALWNHHDAKNVVWTQAGPHLQTAHDEIYTNRDALVRMQDAIDGLTARLQLLEQRKPFVIQFGEGEGLITNVTPYDLTNFLSGPPK